jgi:hypothetical protein
MPAIVPTLEDATSQALANVTNPANAGAARDLGGYFHPNVEGLEGRYVCFRPTFTNAEVISAYIVDIRWDEKRSCLVFEEQSRPDSLHTQQGLVYVPDGKPFMSLVTIDKGSVRLLMVARPDSDLARGLIMTLANPHGTHLIPATAPVVLRRLRSGDASPQLGFIHPNARDYDQYLFQLRSVAPHFGVVTSLAAGELEECDRQQSASASAERRGADQRIITLQADPSTPLAPSAVNGELQDQPIPNVTRLQ